MPRQPLLPATPRRCGAFVYPHKGTGSGYVHTRGPFDPSSRTPQVSTDNTGAITNTGDAKPSYP